MSDALSQAEIDALLNDNSLDVKEENKDDSFFTEQEADTIGEVGNICMGTSATTLYTLLGQKVNITTPRVSVTSWTELAENQTIPYVGVKVEYTKGIKGINLLILKEKDVKIITDLMMGGDGTNVDGELSELHLSAIGEAMNQMIGSAATSMSEMFGDKIDISPPVPFVINFANQEPFGDFNHAEKIVKISFKMIIGDLIDSEFMQLIPIEFAKLIVSNLLDTKDGDSSMTEEQTKQYKQVEDEQIASDQFINQSQEVTQPPVYNSRPAEMQEDKIDYNTSAKPKVDVQPIQFQNFDDNKINAEKQNINIIMDVPLEITVELGHTKRLIKDILEFVPGTIVELDKLTGEPMDILVNGKVIAKGEVVVIDENFGVRITDIVSPSKRV